MGQRSGFGGSAGHKTRAQWREASRRRQQTNTKALCQPPPPPLRTRISLWERMKFLQKKILIWAVFGAQTFGILRSRPPPPPRPSGELCPLPRITCPLRLPHAPRPPPSDPVQRVHGRADRRAARRHGPRQPLHRVPFPQTNGGAAGASADQRSKCTAVQQRDAQSCITTAVHRRRRGGGTPPPPLPFRCLRLTAKILLRRFRCQKDLGLKIFGPPSAGTVGGPLSDSGCASGCTGSTARATAPSLGQPTPRSSQTGQVIWGLR